MISLSMPERAVRRRVRIFLPRNRHAMTGYDNDVMPDVTRRKTRHMPRYAHDNMSFAMLLRVAICCHNDAMITRRANHAAHYAAR